MTTLIANCPHCGASRITFLIRGSQISSDYSGDLFCSCRECGESSIFEVETARVNLFNLLDKAEHIGESLIKSLSLRDTPLVGGLKCPNDVPEHIEKIFNEGSRCASVGCSNASVAMFRLVVDMATRSLLPGEDTSISDLPNAKQRSSTYHRLEWLREKGLIPADLWSLADCVREDGNDAAHDGTLTADDAADIGDFTVALLERLFTEPARLRAAKARREIRRGEIPF